MEFFKTSAVLALALSALAASAAPEGDRSHVADFAGKKIPLIMRDSVAGKTTNVTFKEAKSKELIFTDSDAGGELTIPSDTTSFRFSYGKLDDLNRSFHALNRGDGELALAGMRGYVYPVLGLLVLPESSFYQLNEALDNFVSLLLKQGRIKEATALVKAMPLGQASVPAQMSAMEIGKAMVAAGDVKGAVEVLNRIPLTEEYAEIYPSVLDFAAAIRKTAINDDIQRFYAQLGNSQSNPLKTTCTLWAIYCEISRGSLTSAKLSLGTMKDSFKPSDKDFPLYKMVDGLRAVKENKYAEALDLFAEGIVFAQPSDPCLPELLYNIGKAYKHEKNLTASNEIFKQISLLYPGDPIAPAALKEVVKVEEEKSGVAQN